MIIAVEQGYSRAEHRAVEIPDIVVHEEDAPPAEHARENQSHVPLDA
jgi:hypothetical protein